MEIILGTYIRIHLQYFWAEQAFQFPNTDGQLSLGNAEECS